MFQQQPHFQQPQQPMMAFPTMGQAPAKKRTLNDEEDADELPASQAPQVVVQQQAVGPQGESVYTEVKGKKTRVASFFEDTDYSAELKASRNAIYGIDTAMEEQQEEDDFDYDEAEASYVPRSTYEPTIAPQPQGMQQQQTLYSPPSMSSLTSGSARSFAESSMPSTPIDSPAHPSFLQQQQQQQLAQMQGMSHQQQQMFMNAMTPQGMMPMDVNATPRAPSGFPSAQEEKPISVGMMEDEFPVMDNTPNASFNSSNEIEPYLGHFYGNTRG